jgi:hypothetical protein
MYAHDADGQRIRDSVTRSLWVMQPGPAWDAFLADECRAGAAVMDATACFIDTLGDAARIRVSRPIVNPATGGAYTAQEWAADVSQLAVSVQRDSGTSVVGNNVCAPASGFTLGCESYPLPTIEESIALVDSGAAYVIAKNLQARGYALATFLLAAGVEDRIAIATRTHPAVWWPNLGLAIGRPTGAAQELAAGAWRRVYTHGTVLVASRLATQTWTYRAQRLLGDWQGHASRTWTLTPGTGLVLEMQP